MGGCEAIRNVVVYRRTGNAVHDEGRTRRLDARPRRDAARHVRAGVGERRASAVHPLHVGVDRQAEGRAALDRRLPAVGGPDDEVGVRLQADDVFWCTADIGWVTGHTYIAYGPLACGATEVVFEGVPTYPDAGRFWEMIQEHKVTMFYTAPTAIRSLIKASEAERTCTRSATTCRACACSAPSASRSIRKRGCGTTTNVGDERCPIVDTFWQTETGGHMITPLPGVDAVQAGLVHVAAARASWPRSSTRPATTCRTARAASSSSSGRGRR